MAVAAWQILLDHCPTTPQDEQDDNDVGLKRKRLSIPMDHSPSNEEDPSLSPVTKKKRPTTVASTATMSLEWLQRVSRRLQHIHSNILDYNAVQTNYKLTRLQTQKLQASLVTLQTHYQQLQLPDGNGVGGSTRHNNSTTTTTTSTMNHAQVLPPTESHVEFVQEVQRANRFLQRFQSLPRK